MNIMKSWILESWQSVTVTCVKKWVSKALCDTSTPEIEDEESTSENELSDVHQKRL
jgi:hypothetical protein